MSTEERIEHIESFLHQQRDLRGLLFRIVEENGEFTIEFKEATERQVWTLRHALNKAMMHHIHCKALTEIKYSKPRKKL